MTTPRPHEPPVPATNSFRDGQHAEVVRLHDTQRSTRHHTELVLGVGVVEVERLEDLTPDQMRNATVVVYLSKGASSHAEVICRIKGIRMIPSAHATDVTNVTTSHVVSTQAIKAFAHHRGGFQVVVTSAEDLWEIDLTNVRSVFVRMEHLLYWNPDVWDPTTGIRSRAGEQLSQDLSTLRAALPAGVRLLVRGLDVRSNDSGIGHWFHDGVESNPELGMHGLRWLLHARDWMAVEVDAVRRTGGGVVYAVPFVSKLQEYQEFRDRYSELLPAIVPFVESVAALRTMDSFPKSDGPGSIGLKDIAQFYFAADRTNSTVASMIDYLDTSFMDFVASSLRPIIESGRGIAIYQDIEILGSYSRLLGPTGWMPSIAASEFRALSEAARRAGLLA